MFGVVLWSDAETGKAVIWCEDHGDLAFYNETGAGEEVLLGAGDLVEFELSVDRQFRYAENPQLVSDSYAFGLADALAPDAVSPQGVAQPGDASAELTRMSAEIVPFRPRRSNKGNAAKPVRRQL